MIRWSLLGHSLRPRAEGGQANPEVSVRHLWRRHIDLIVAAVFVARNGTRGVGQVRHGERISRLIELVRDEPRPVKRWVRGNQPTRCSADEPAKKKTPC